MSELKELIARSTEINNGFFNEGCSIYGDRGWAATLHDCEETQLSQFYSIGRMMRLHGKSVLDIGCGQGDFLGFMKQNKIVPSDYVGIDLCPKMIEFAKQKHPESNFQVEHLLKINEGRKFDYVVACGVLNFSIGDTLEQHTYVKECLKKIYGLANISAGVTFLSAFGIENIEPELHQYDPGKVFDYCMTLTTTAALDHTLNGMFTVVMIKEQK